MTQRTSISARNSTRSQSFDTTSTMAKESDSSMDTFIKEVDVWSDVAFRHVVTREFEDEVFTAGVEILFHVTEADDVEFAGTGAGRGVVPAACVLRHHQHVVPFVGDEPGARGHVRRALSEHRVLGRASLPEVDRVEEQRVDGLLTLDVGDADPLASPHGSRPRRSGRDEVLLAAVDRSGHPLILYDIETAQLFSNPRATSALAVRQTSSTVGAGARNRVPVTTAGVADCSGSRASDPI